MKQSIMEHHMVKYKEKVKKKEMIMKGLLRYWGDTGEEKKEPVETHYVLLYNHSSRSIQIELRRMRLETREAKLLQ